MEQPLVYDFAGGSSSSSSSSSRYASAIAGAGAGAASTNGRSTNANATGRIHKFSLEMAESDSRSHLQCHSYSNPDFNPDFHFSSNSDGPSRFPRKTARLFFLWPTLLKLVVVGGLVYASVDLYRYHANGNANSNGNGNGNDNDNDNDNNDIVDNHGNPATFVWIISHKQTSSSRLSCRVAPIHSIPNCNLRPKSTPNAAAAAAAAPSALPPGRNRTETNKSTAGGSSKPPKRKGFGLLGNLVGAQRRTNHQVVKASKASGTKAQPSAAEPQAQAGTKTKTKTDPSAEHPAAGDDVSDANDASPLLGSGEVLKDFRHEMEQKMLDFDISDEVSMKVFVRLADHTKKVREEDKGRITMEILKYIVYEQAEEVNEEWIAHKEPGEFTDEITVAIYKDAESAPPEVIEEMNQAEIPEEMKAQQKMIEQKRRQEETNARRIQEVLQRQALRKMAESSGGGGGQGLSVLNKEKRDLRTIEEIQQDSAKRRKME
mmetsp:Transcript_27422/g.64268  ORF Transcript_27422/g.64268 Transcript_27422/m.64268 type:complete len:488 (+) Transcript_27422:278-1741(+)